jgi:indole-3-glycerol phosphate synthase
MVPDYDPIRLALAYERGGAGMVSVLTEPRRFLGTDENLTAVRAAVSLPILRKDFVVDPYQVIESWALGADVILFIVAALGKSLLLELAAAARELGLGVLIETHEAGEIESASAAQPDAIGVNARNLRDFSMDTDLAASLLRLLPKGPARVAESGLLTPAATASLREAGYEGFLVGEALATASDPESATRNFAAAIAGVGRYRQEQGSA